MNPVIYGILLSTASGMATGIGAIPFVFMKRGGNEKLMDALLGFAAGVMLAATAFSLVVPAIEIGGFFKFFVGFFLGAIVVDLIDQYSPHEHFLKGHEGTDIKRLSKIWLFVIAITIHNLPEGMAVGVGSFTKEAIPIAFAIGLQNIPEGAAVAGALLNAGYNPKTAFLIAFFTGIVEVAGGILGVSIMTISRSLLPYMMAFAGGAMLFVISDEVIPETHLRGNERLATYFVMIGFFVMAVMDVVLG